MRPHHVWLLIGSILGLSAFFALPHAPAGARVGWYMVTGLSALILSQWFTRHVWRGRR